MAAEYIFFDCDDCLYQNDWKTANKITAAIAKYCDTIGVTKEQAYELYQTHGTALKGMLKEGILTSDKVDEYLEQAHNIDYSDIASNPELTDIVRRCATKANRFVFTASIREHADRCLANVFGPAATMDELFSVIVDTRTCKLETKHAESSFEAAMAAAGVPKGEGAKCMLLDDSVKNIKRAKAQGWQTVLVGKTVRETGMTLETPPEADYHVASLLELPSVLPALFVKEKVAVASVASVASTATPALPEDEESEDEEGGLAALMGADFDDDDRESDGDFEASAEEDDLDIEDASDDDGPGPSAAKKPRVD